MSKNTVLIIGGGASGLMAGIICARAGVKVTLLERMNRVGKKILATGNGRCNLTNLATSIEAFHGKNPNFCLPVLNKLNVHMTLDFFKSLGVFPRIEEDLVYPFSNQASSVLDVLRYEIDRLGVKIVCDEEVCEINKKNNQFILTTRANKYYSSKVILCTGGNSSPNLGSNGSGFELARQLGHKIIQPLPGLVQLKAEETYLKHIKGVRVAAKVRLIHQDKEVISEEGEILFTDYGLSGIAILQISRYVSELINNKAIKVKVVLDLMPNYDWKVVDRLLIERFQHMPFKTLEDSLVGLFNRKLIPVLIKLANLNLNEPVSQLTKDKRLALVTIIKNMTFQIKGTQDWEHSQVTVGGVSTGEVNPNTLESLLHKNLYFAGEVLDIDGDCGGYNLQWAWSSGYVAGKSASETE